MSKNLSEAGFMTGVNIFVSTSNDNQIVFHAHIAFADESCDFIVQELKRGLKAIGYEENDSYYDLTKTMKFEIVKEPIKKESIPNEYEEILENGFIDENEDDEDFIII